MRPEILMAECYNDNESLSKNMSGLELLIIRSMYIYARIRNI